MSTAMRIKKKENKKSLLPRMMEYIRPSPLETHIIFTIHPALAL
jgi:hypothetical protein